MLEDDYESIVLRPTFGECPKAGLTDIGAAVESVEEDDNMVELLYVSDEYGFEHEISENFVAPKEGDEPAVEVEIVAEEAVSPEPKQLRRIPGRKKIKKGIKLETGIDEKTGEETIVLHNVDEEGDDTTQELDHPSEEFITPDTHVSNMPRRRTRSSRCLPASVQPLAATIERRSRKSTRDAEQVKKEHDTSSEFLVSPSNETSPRKRKRGNNLMNDTDCPQKTGEAHDIMKNEIEGDSDDEFPARDSDNEDWPAQETLNAFPKEILRDGLLIVKGKQLMSIINKYIWECHLQIVWFLLKMPFRLLSDFINLNANHARTSGDTSILKLELNLISAHKSSMDKNSFSSDLQALERIIRTLLIDTQRGGLCDLLSNKIESLSGHNYAYGQTHPTRTVQVSLEEREAHLNSCTLLD